VAGHKDRTIPNLTYKAGIKGWGVINRMGTDYLVPFDKMGELVQKWIDDPRDGLNLLANGESAAIEPVRMEIYHNALHVDEFETTDAFRAAVEALPDPAEYTTPGATQANESNFQGQTIEAINEIYDRLRSLERVMRIERGGSDVPGSSRAPM